MKNLLLVSLAIFGAISCRSSTSGNVEISAETRALWKAERAAYEKEKEKEKKQNLEDWKERDLERSERVKLSQQAQSELKQFRERAVAADPIAEAHGSQVYQFENRIYAQQVIDGEIEMEVVADSWKQDDEELVFLGNAVGRAGKIAMSASPKHSEIRLLPNGKYKVVSKPDRVRGAASRMMIPIESN